MRLLKGHIRPRLLLLLIFTILAGDVFTQDYSITVFGKKQGLDCNYVNDIVRDELGFYWVGTSQGLFRFDGASFLSVPGGGANSSHIRRLRLIKNKLYVMHMDESGVDVVNTLTMERDHFTEQSFTDILPIDDQELVAFDPSGDLVKIKNKKVERSIRLEANNDGTLVSWRNYLFINLQSKFLYCVDPVSLKIIRRYELPGLEFARAGFQVRHDKLIIHMLGAVVYIDENLELKFFDAIPGSQFGNSHSLTFYSDNLQYFIRSDRELVVNRQGRVSGINVGVGNIPELRTIYLVDSSNLLIGANGTLIHFTTHPRSIENFNSDDSVSSKSIRVRRNILPVEKDQTILSGFPGFMTWQGKSVTLEQSFKAAYFSDAVRFGDKIFSVGEGRSIHWWNYKTNKTATIQSSLILESDQLICLQADYKAGVIFLAGKGGIYRLDPASGAITRITQLSNLIVTRLKKTSYGDWWLCTDKGLIRAGDDFRELERFEKKKGRVRLNSDNISDFLPITESKFWVGHDKGAQLVDLDRGLVIDSIPDHLLVNSNIADILKDQNDRVWFSTFDGLIIHDPGSGSYLRLDEKSNLINREFNRRSSAILPDGRLIFGGVSGYDLIDPKRFNFSKTADSGFISAVQWKSGSGQITKTLITGFDKELNFNPDKESIRVYFSMRDMLETHHSKFQYRFNDGSWNKIEENNFLDVAKLKPGRNMLAIRAFDRTGTLISYNSLYLVAEEAFYKSTRFVIVILSGLIISLIFIIIMIRRNQFMDLKIKQGIAMDLHDEVGTLLNRALMVTRAPKIRDKEGKVQDYLAEAIFSLRTYVRTISTTTFTAEELQTELQEVLHSRLEYTGKTYEVSSNFTHEGSYSSSLCRDVRLALYELINNALKHSFATHVKLTINGSQSSIRLNFTDNGNLKSTEELIRNGNGLNNIETRVKRNKGTATWRVNDTGNGLSALLEFKCNTP